LNRRDFILTGGAVAGASLISGCSRSQFEDKGVNIKRQKKIKLKLATSWPDNFPIMGTGVTEFADRVREASGGSIEIEVYGKNRLVPALAVFDTASTGGIDIFHSGPYYWKGKSLAISIFGGVPFGMTPIESVSWFKNGGGYDLWREIYDRYNLHPLLGGNTGPQMGGWFRKRIEKLDDLSGLKMRIPGLGGELFARLGVNPVLLPAGEIFTSLERGTIDASEWVGPALDLKMGFHRVAKYYYSGWTEPGSILELTFNKMSWNRLSKEQQSIIEIASEELNSNMLYNFQSENSLALTQIKMDSSIEINSFPKEIIEKAKVENIKLIDEFVAKDRDFAKVWSSYSKFLSENRSWTSLSSQNYLNARGESH
jgi:TRAP-type mannitol/chloroaromatic compound transport system substrate-binding protein